MKPNWEDITNNPFQFMEIITSSVLTDFFSNKVTQYSKKMLGSRDELRNKIKLLNESKN